jgi:hypothetical protein
LKARFVRRALRPGPHPIPSATALPGLTGEYGYQMQLWTGPGPEGREEKRELVAFGHSGSDGTHAWVFPDQKALVLYFTQSRGGTTGLRVEEVLGELFLGAEYDPNEDAPPFEDYLGYYRENEQDLYRAIVRDGDELALEILGRAVVPLTYAGGDRWKLRPDPSKVLAFDRSEDGEVTGYHIGDHQEFRFEPSDALPSVEEVVERVTQAHRIDLVESLGAVRIQAGLAIEQLGLSGSVRTLLAWPDRFRVDTVVGDDFEHLVHDGTRLMYSSKTKPAAELTGLAAELLRVENAFARFGDWRRWYPELRVIQRIQRGDEDAILVRTGGTARPATTFYVDAETGTVGRVDGLSHVEPLGRISQRVSFGDYREVSGMRLPFRYEVEIVNPMAGIMTVTLKVSEVEVGFELGNGAFELAD